MKINKLIIRNMVLIFFITLLFAGASCEKTNTPGELKLVTLSQKQKDVLDKSNAFGFEFFKAVQPYIAQNKNMMVSPLSVSMALGMTRNGAAGSTLDGMNTTLGFSDMSDDQINDSYKYIIETFTALDPKVKLAIANSIWYRNNFTVENDFLNVNKNYFNATVSPLNFSDPKSVSTINNWVSDNTNKLIPKIIDGIPDQMVMYLINAVYFKGQWRNQFDKSKTVSKPFYLTDGSTVSAPAMMQQADLQYFKGAGFEALQLPYNQGNFNMTVLLPEAGSSINSLIAQLSQQNWTEWSKDFSQHDVVLQLPKFKYEYEQQKMIDVLSQMGMGVAFDPDNADFTRINKDGGLFISEVKHKTFIETNEEGTEAAAVTSVGIGVTSVGPGSTVYFTVNRPFVYFISEKTSGAILFIGVVYNPL